jgi:hypothetical protein
MSLVPSINQGARGNITRTETHGNASPQSSAAVDVVAVFGANGEQLFPLARPAKASISRWSKIAEHPVESGGKIVDNRVIQPTEIELTLYVTEIATTYERLKTAFLGNELITVQTRAGIFADMAIEGMPHDETPESADVFVLQLELKEVKLVTAQFQALPPQKVRSKNDASTVNRGEQNTRKTDNRSAAAKAADRFLK